MTESKKLLEAELAKGDKADVKILQDLLDKVAAESKDRVRKLSEEVEKAIGKNKK